MSAHTHFEELISEKLDGVISAADEQELTAHLASCQDCRELMTVLSAAHEALDFKAEPPEDLRKNVMEAVRAEKNRKKIRLRAMAGALAAAAVLAVAIVPAAVRLHSEEADTGIAPASLTREGNTPVGEDPTGYTVIGPTGVRLPLKDGPSVYASVEDRCADYAAVAWFDALPEEILSTAPQYSFADGSTGYEVTEEQFTSLLPSALRVTHPDPAGTQYMAVLSAHPD